MIRSIVTVRAMKRVLRWAGVLVLLGVAGLALMFYTMPSGLKDVASKIRIGMSEAQVIELVGQPSEELTSNVGYDVKVVCWDRGKESLAVYLDPKTRRVVDGPFYDVKDIGVLESVLGFFRHPPKSDFRVIGTRVPNAAPPE